MIENFYSELNTPIVEKKHHEDVWVNNNGLDELIEEG